MKVQLLKDCQHGKAGQVVWVDWNTAATLVAAGTARRVTWKELVITKG